jgi:hypothetical protein
MKKQVHQPEAVNAITRRGSCCSSPALRLPLERLGEFRRHRNDLIEQFVGFRFVVHSQCRQSQFSLLQFLAYTFGFGCAFENCDPRIGEIKRVIAADIHEVGKHHHTFATNSIGTKSKHTRNASAGIARSVHVVLSCARKWSVTVQSATPTCIWSVPASWIFTALVVTMLSGPCKAMSACFQYF